MEPFVLKEATNDCRPLLLESWMAKHPKLTAGFSTRPGGVSEGPYASLNCGLHVEDDPSRVVENRRRLSAALGAPFDASVYAEQVHGKEIQVVGALQRGAGREAREDALQGKDGFVTKEPGVVLHALFADCVPLFFYDPVKQAVGLAHAGWKGTALGIAAATVETMSAAFGSRPRDLKAAIGPSIGRCCYEVDDRVMDRMEKSLRDIWVADAQEPLYERMDGGKAMLNLQQINRQIMIKAGILPSGIEISGLCTSCRTDLFYSHRKEGGRTGRMSAWIGLAP